MESCAQAQTTVNVSAVNAIVTGSGEFLDIQPVSAELATGPASLPLESILTRSVLGKANVCVESASVMRVQMDSSAGSTVRNAPHVLESVKNLKLGFNARSSSLGNCLALKRLGLEMMNVVKVHLNP